MYKIICKQCQSESFTKDNRKKFCSSSCSTKFNNEHRKPPTEEQRKKTSERIKKYWMEHPERKSVGIKHSKAVGNSTKGKYKGDNIKSIFDVSKRTTTKILKRLNIGCCICKWNEGSCDVHHINGKKVEDANGHWNLTYICPNHHRMYHNGKIKKEDFVSLDKHIPENWKELYYG